MMELELGLVPFDKNQIDDDAMLANKIASARQSSQMLIDAADQRIQPRFSIEGTDRPVPALIQLSRTLSEQLEADISNLPQDRNYARRCNDLFEEYNRQRYGLTKQHDSRNEASPKRRRN